MKKLVLFLAVATAVAFASCGNKEAKQETPVAEEPAVEAESETLTLEDKWIISRVNDAAEYVTKALERYDLALAGQRVYELIWNEYCDWYIELVKARLWGEDEEDKKVVRFTLVMCLKNMLKMLHPFMPFITEEIWLHLPHEGETIMRTDWPKFDDALTFENEDKQMSMIMDAIKAVRNTRAGMNVPPSRKAKLYIQTEDKEIFANGQNYFKKLASASETKVYFICWLFLVLRMAVVLTHL